MAVDASAYAALGLAPDADSAAIEAAYHPDREGGDAQRATEINLAYREIRAERNLKDPLELNSDRSGMPGGARGWIWIALLLAACVGLLAATRSWLSNDASARAPRPIADHSRAAAASPDPMDQPLHVQAIDIAARNALQLVRTSDEMALASASRDCHHKLRNDPNLLQLDRCVAFDDAVVQLEDRDPLRDQGPFSELAVTGRLWSGATELLADYMAIDGRLDRIRLRVELALASAVEPPSN